MLHDVLVKVVLVKVLQKLCKHKIICVTYTHTWWGKGRFTVVHVENNKIINKEGCKNELCVSHTHNCKPTFASPSI